MFEKKGFQNIIEYKTNEQNTKYSNLSMQIEI